jgi:hypothetical protein
VSWLLPLAVQQLTCPLGLRAPPPPIKQVSEHPKCRIKLTVMEESSGKGKAAGHKVKLMAALVLAGTSTEGLSKPGRLAAISQR